jgi:hypothetical protein
MTNSTQARQARQNDDASRNSEGVDDRVQHLAERIRTRAGSCLFAARLCLFALFVALLAGVALFLWANKIVDSAVPLSPPTNIRVADNSQAVTINVDQSVSKETAGAVLDLDWQVRVLNQVSALFARVGVVCLLIFLMQFVMRLFRYYHATYLFFLARADALYLSDPDAIDLEKALLFLSPQAVDFGGLPKSPIESIGSTARAAVDAVKNAGPG